VSLGFSRPQKTQTLGQGKFWILLSLQHTKHKIHKSRVESGRTKIHLNFLHFIFCTFATRRIKRGIFPYSPPFYFFLFFRCCSSRCLHAKFVLVCLSACQLACCMVLGGICFAAPPFYPPLWNSVYYKGNNNSNSPSRNLDTHPVRTLDGLRVLSGSGSGIRHLAGFSDRGTPTPRAFPAGGS